MRVYIYGIFFRWLLLSLLQKFIDLNFILQNVYNNSDSRAIDFGPNRISGFGNAQNLTQLSFVHDKFRKNTNMLKCKRSVRFFIPVFYLIVSNHVLICFSSFLSCYLKLKPINGFLIAILINRDCYFLKEIIITYNVFKFCTSYQRSCSVQIRISDYTVIQLILYRPLIL